MPEVSERWEKYKDSLSKARRNYISKKKNVSVLLDPEDYEEIKAYADEHGISLQRLFKETVLEMIRS